MTTIAYSGEDFCITHGREHMRSQMGNPIPFCQICENEQQFVNSVISDVAELPDRNSPEDEPDMMLVTAEELKTILRERLSEISSR